METNPEADRQKDEATRSRFSQLLDDIHDQASGQSARQDAEPLTTGRTVPDSVEVFGPDGGMMPMNLEVYGPGDDNYGRGSDIYNDGEPADSSDHRRFYDDLEA